MLPSYRLFPRILRWFRRFPQRRGYGVHSPFAFEWITDVVYNQQAQYYAYAPLSQQHKQWSGVLSIKDARLLFRMANHLRAKCILWWDKGWTEKRTTSKRRVHRHRLFCCQTIKPCSNILRNPLTHHLISTLCCGWQPKAPMTQHLVFFLNPTIRVFSLHQPPTICRTCTPPQFGCCSLLTMLPHAQRRGKPSSSRNGAPSLSTCTASEWLFTIPNCNDNTMSSTISNPLSLHND